MQNQELIYSTSQLNKLGNTLIFLCKHLERPTKTHLLKLVFIIEEISILRFGIPFLNLRFDVWKLGPVSKDLYVELTEEPYLLEEYISKKIIEDTAIFSGKKDFSDGEFSDIEINLLNEITHRFKDCTAKELINFTHKKDSIWYNTALRNGVLFLLESGKMTTTNIEIDMSELIAGEEEKMKLYLKHKEFLNQSQSLKN